MIEDREQDRLDSLTARAGEFFKDYLVMVRRDDGHVSWRSSDAVWAEGAARQYVNFVQMGNHLQQIEDFHRRD